VTARNRTPRRRGPYEPDDGARRDSARRLGRTVDDPFDSIAAAISRDEPARLSERDERVAGFHRESLVERVSPV